MGEDYNLTLYLGTGALIIERSSVETPGLPLLIFLKHEFERHKIGNDMIVKFLETFKQLSLLFSAEYFTHDADELKKVITL